LGVQRVDEADDLFRSRNDGRNLLGGMGSELVLDGGAMFEEFGTDGRSLSLDGGGLRREGGDLAVPGLVGLGLGLKRRIGRSSFVVLRRWFDGRAEGSVWKGGRWGRREVTSESSVEYSSSSSIPLRSLRRRNDRRWTWLDVALGWSDWVR